jgi:glycine cleavage system H lipoate-binding protein
MAVLLGILTIAALIGIDVLFLRARRARRAEAVAPPRLPPLSESITRLPQGVFLHPTFTWSRVREDGDVVLGIHPLLFGLVGAPYQIDVLSEGQEVERGGELVKLGRSGRRLTVRSPVSGRISAVNDVLTGEAEWDGVEADDGRWVYRITPQGLGEEVPSWFVAERASEWSRRQYERFKEYLFGVLHAGELGLTMTDGGDVPNGILGRLAGSAWDGIQQEFLDP